MFKVLQLNDFVRLGTLDYWLLLIKVGFGFSGSMGINFFLSFSIGYFLLLIFVIELRVIVYLEEIKFVVMPAFLAQVLLKMQSCN